MPSLPLRYYLQLRGVLGFDKSQQRVHRVLDLRTRVNDLALLKCELALSRPLSLFKMHRRTFQVSRQRRREAGELVRISDDPLSCGQPEADRGGLPWTGFLVVRKFH